MIKKIWTSVLIIGLVAALAGVGTYALYTDQASSAGNTFGGGVLDLKIDGSDTAVPMVLENLAPGDWSWAYHYVIYYPANAGNVPAGRLSFKIDNLSADGGAWPAPEQAVDADNSGDLSDNVKVAVWFPTYWGSDLVGEYTIAELESGITITDDFDADVAAAGGYVLVEFDAILPAAAGNEVMGDSLTFDGHFTLEQKP